MYSIPFLFKEKVAEKYQLFYMGIFIIFYNFRVCARYKFVKFLVKNGIVILDIINNLITLFLILDTKP